MKRFITLCLCLLLLTSCAKKLTTRTTTTDQLALPAKGETIAVMHTAYGDVKFRLFPDDAPKAVDNFISLAKDGKYNATKIFRSEPNYLMQGGDYENNNGTGGKSASGKPFGTETSNSLHNVRGALGMARAEAYDSCASQFYVVTRAYASVAYTEKLKESDPALAEKYEKNGGIPELDGDYTVFGQAFEGLDVLDTLNALPVDEENHPVEDLYIMSIEITTYQ